MLCSSDFNIRDGWVNDVKRHIELKKYVDSLKASASSQKKTSFFLLEAPLISRKRIWSWVAVFCIYLCTGPANCFMLCEFICEHNLPIATAGLVGKLLNVIFPDSETGKKYFGSQTNTTRISSWTVAKESITNLKLTLSSSYSGS